VSLLELAQALIRIAGRGSYRSFLPRERKRIDIGDFYADIGKIARCSAGSRARRCRPASNARSPTTTAQGAVPVSTPGPRAASLRGLRAHVRALRGEIDAALARVLDSGWFILGPECEALERSWRSSSASARA